MLNLKGPSYAIKTNGLRLVAEDNGPSKNPEPISQAMVLIISEFSVVVHSTRNLNNGGHSYKSSIISLMYLELAP